MEKIVGGVWREGREMVRGRESFLDTTPPLSYSLQPPTTPYIPSSIHPFPILSSSGCGGVERSGEWWGGHGRGADGGGREGTGRKGEGGAEGRGADEMGDGELMR